jgi:L-ascorbate metabolism protein UlaG (beta-lactamase superfamily)
MIIQYFGKQFFKVSKGDFTVAINPVSKDSKDFNKAKFGSNVVLITTNHPDFNGIESATFGENTPFIINGPGEYEVGDMYVQGFESRAEIDKKEYINTIYLVTLDDIKMVFIGALSNKDSIPKNFIETVESPDLFFVPIGGASTIDAGTAQKLANSFNAKMVVPMDYDNASLKSFLKESGAEGVKPIDKLTVKKKDFSGKEGSVVIFE